MRLKEYDNSWYNTGASFSKRALWYIVNILVFINPMFPISSFKVYILRLFGAKIGKGVYIKPSVNIKYPWRLWVGDHVWIGEKVWIDNLDYVILGNNVCISQGAMLLCGNHNYKKRGFDLIIKPIHINDGCWIGAKSIVCPGTNMREYSVLSVGTVVSGDVDAYSIYQGVPGNKIKERVIK